MAQLFSKFISRAFAVCALTVLWCALAGAQQPALAGINYQLAMSRPVSHLFEVKIEVALAEGPSADHLDFQMPRWSPGRYAVFDFAKNVQEVQAAAGICRPKERCDLAARPVTRL